MSLLSDVASVCVSACSAWRAEQLGRKAIQQEKELYVKGVATSTEQHYQALTAELTTAAKEADRDVWEQRNVQFNNLLVCATLMFGLAMGTVVEGSFAPEKVRPHQSLPDTCLDTCRSPAPAARLLQNASQWIDLLFVTPVGLALVSLFLCLRTRRTGSTCCSSRLSGSRLSPSSYASSLVCS